MSGADLLFEDFAETPDCSTCDDLGYLLLDAGMETERQIPCPDCFIEPDIDGEL
jgi:hypothetical protein